MQTVAAARSRSAVPAAQSVHEMDTAAAYWPVEQKAHAVDGVLSVSAVPAAQSMHAAVPAAVFSVPAAQAVQVELILNTVP